MIPLRDTIPTRRTPVVTWTLIAVNAAVFLFELSLGPGQLQRLLEWSGLVPARFHDPLWAASAGFPAGGISTFFSSMFLHNGWTHVLANLWTLWIFGDNVEDRMGRVRFLLFYLIAGLLAGIVHCLIHAHSTIPAIGASGSIAGVLGAYFVLFPRARVVAVLPVLFFLFFFEMPAILYLFVWIGSQVLGGTLASLGAEKIGMVAWWAHTGAFLAGIALCRFQLNPARAPILRPRFETHWPDWNHRKWPGSHPLPSHSLKGQGGISPALKISTNRSANLSGARSHPSAT